MKKNSERKQSLLHIGASWRAILIGAILVPVNVYWIMVMNAADQSYPTTVSLYFNVVFCIFVLTLLNFLINRINPILALKQGELLTIYIMLAIASSISGCDFSIVLISIIPHAFWYATPENEWAELFHQYVPDWVVVKDHQVLTDYYKGDSTLYMAENIKSWVTPVLWWSAFLFALIFIMICINSIVRKRWTEEEKLSYPIIQLPLELTTGGGITGVLKSKAMWIGFGVAALIDIINGLHFLYPSIPGIGGRLYDLRVHFTEKPWNAIGWTPIALLPFAVGLAFFIPLDLSFSCWFFYLFWKCERIVSSILGFRNLPDFPYVDEQSFGAYLALFVIAVFATRNHLKRVFLKIITNTQDVDDSHEPMPYRLAMFGLVAGVIFLVGFCRSAGMSVWVILMFFGIYYTISTAVTRMRAELGSPVHDLHFMGPDEMLPRMFGTRRLGAPNLTMFSYLFSFNRAYRGHPMPHQLEGFKLAERTGINNRRLLLAMLIAVAVGIIASFWSYLHISYVHGTHGSNSGYGWRPFNRTQSWLTNPLAPNHPATIAVAVGFLTTLLLWFMRVRMFWWPFHPAGFAISSSWSMNVFWFSIFFSSVVKWIILKQGGLKMHRKAIPFFLGLVLGEFVIGSIWSLIGITTNRPMYRFLY
ncbi:DUF6785 family protein [Candidatus Poribacteria bacterium]